MSEARRYAVIENGIVTNVIKADAEFIREQGLLAVDVTEEFVDIGWLYNETTHQLSEPPKPDPAPDTES